MPACARPLAVLVALAVGLARRGLQLGRRRDAAARDRRRRRRAPSSAGSERSPATGPALVFRVAPRSPSPRTAGRRTSRSRTRRRSTWELGEDRRRGRRSRSASCSSRRATSTRSSSAAPTATSRGSGRLDVRPPAARAASCPGDAGAGRSRRTARSRRAATSARRSARWSPRASRPRGWGRFRLDHRSRLPAARLDGGAASASVESRYHRSPADMNVAAAAA